MNETEAQNPPIAVYPFLNFKVIKKMGQTDSVILF